MRFLLVDRILRLEEGKDAVVRKNVANSEDFFADHFEGRPIMPGCLILETCDQAARLLLAKTVSFEFLPSLEQVANAKLERVVRPGDSVEVHVVLIRLTAEGADVRASAAEAGRPVAKASLRYRMIPATADAMAARACARLRGFYETLATDTAALLAGGTTHAPRANGEGDGA
jgi:3-hydroxyacyl-[acyl-carrier-protein] dehydratase